MEKDVDHLELFGGDDDMLTLRRDPLEYMEELHWTPETFVHCLCNALSSDKFDDIKKSKLMIAFQEHALILITQQESFLETMQTLNTLFQLTKTSTEVAFRAQILVTMSSVLFMCEELIDKEIFTSWLIAHYHQLWKLIQRVNNNIDIILRETACECLIYMEEYFPCILLNKLEDLLSLSVEENLLPFQNYNNLTMVVLQNAAMFNSAHCTRSNEILSLMADKRATNEVRDSIISSVNVEQTLNQVMDLISLLSPCSVYFIVSRIKGLVLPLKLSPSVFDNFVCPLYCSHNLLMIHLKLILRNVYSTHEVIVDKECFIKEITALSTHPHFKSSQQCVLLFWILEHSSNSNLACKEEHCYPLPWDDLNTVERKLCILIATLCRNPENKSYVFLHFERFISTLSYDDAGQRIASLCRLMFYVYSRFEDGDINMGLIKIAMSVLRYHPQFTSRILDLTNKMKSLKSNCTVPSMIISSAVMQVVDLLDEIAFKNVMDICILLRRAVEDELFELSQEIVKILLKIVEIVIKEEKLQGSSLGHLILDVCKQMLCYLNMDMNTSEVGEVLCKLFSEHGDRDVRDRAQFYYVLRTTLSPTRVTEMLNFQPQRESGSSSNNMPQPCLDVALKSTVGSLQIVPDIIFKLSKLPARFTQSDVPGDFPIIEDITLYFQMLKNKIKWSTELQFSACIMPNVEEKYEALYAVVLSFQGASVDYCSQDIEIMHMQRDQEPVILTLNLTPQSAIPPSISASAVFNLKDGTTCFSQLSSIRLQLQDLFQPLPIPDHCACHTSWRKWLSEQIWDYFTVQHKKIGHKSFVNIFISREEFQILLDTVFKPFLTSVCQSTDSEINCMVGIFLPQHSHIILKFKHCNLGLATSLVSDNQDALPQMNIFLRDLENV